MNREYFTINEKPFLINADKLRRLCEIPTRLMLMLLAGKIKAMHGIGMPVALPVSPETEEALPPEEDIATPLSPVHNRPSFRVCARNFESQEYPRNGVRLFLGACSKRLD